MSRAITKGLVRRVLDCLGRGYSERDTAQIVGVNRWTVVLIRAGKHGRRMNAQPGEFIITASDRRFAALVAERRREFNRAWRNNEPWLMAAIDAWSPPPEVLQAAS